MGWEDITGSTGFQIGYPLLNSLLAASSPAGHRAAQGLNVGMGVANYYAQQKKQDEQNALLRQKLADVFKSTNQTPAANLPGATTNLGMAAEEEAGMAGLSAPQFQSPSEATAAAPSFAGQAPRATEIAPATSTPIFSPQMQKLGEALSAANRPDLALGVAERAMSRQQQQPHTFGSPETGYYTVGQNGEAVPLVQGVGRREPTPPRPVLGTQGAEGVREVYNPETKKWEQTRSPLTAAPARQLSPEQQRLQQLQAGLVTARTGLANASTAHMQALTKRTQALVNTPQGSALYKEFVSIGGDPEDQQGFLDYVKQRSTAGRRKTTAELLLGDEGGAAPATKQPQNANDRRRKLKDILSGNE